jgi:small subunit ribosomal protein S14
MKRGEKNITKDLIKRKIYIKYELKKIILKSIIQNKNTKPVIRSYAYYKTINYDRKNSISKQINVCLVRGRHKGVWKFAQLCRHAINKFATTGFLQNMKIKSW